MIQDQFDLAGNQMPYRTEILFSAPTPDEEVDRTEIVAKALPKIRELQAHLKEIGLDVTLIIKSVNSIPGRSHSRRQAPTKPVGYTQAAE